MFDSEHKIFITESYFKNAEQQENGEWKYSVEHCVNDFQNAFPNFPVDSQKLLQQIHKCVAKFRSVGTVSRKPGSGAPKKELLRLWQMLQQEWSSLLRNLSAG
jgi:hypothetical protein